MRFDSLLTCHSPAHFVSKRSRKRDSNYDDDDDDEEEESEIADE